MKVFCYKMSWEEVKELHPTLPRDYCYSRNPEELVNYIKTRCVSADTLTELCPKPYKIKNNQLTIITIMKRTICKILLTLATLTFSYSISSAHDFEVDGIYYNITSSIDKTVEVTYKGSQWHDNSYEYYTDSVVIPSIVTYLGSDYSVISIRSEAFRGCTSVNYVTIPNSVIEIGTNAFNNTGWYNSQPDGILYLNNCCLGYKGHQPTGSLIIAENTRLIACAAFYNCTALTSVTIPDSVTEIGSSVFSGCSGLTYIMLGDGVKEIGSSAFADCTSLTSITIPNSVTSIGSDAFCGCTGLTDVTIPNSVIKIGDYAFSRCSELTDIVIPNSVKSIGRTVFHSTGWYNSQPDGILYLNNCCLGYKGHQPTGSLIIAENTRLIAGAAFSDCTGLTDVTIPNTVTTIGSAFYRCTGLTKIVIPNSVTTIKSSAFSNCTGLTEVTIPSSVTEIGSSAFADCTSLTSITIPNSVTKIENSTFSGCIGLTSATIPNSVQSIGDKVFSGCTGLTEIYIPNSVTTIGRYTFQKCTGLTSITIPHSVITIGNYAFESCFSLKDLKIENGAETLYLGYNYLDYYGNIKGGLFSNCPLESISLGRNLGYDKGSYNNYTPFANQTTLKSVTLGDCVTIISDGTFYGCIGLTEVTIPNSVTKIGDSAFYDCTGLTSIMLGDGVKEIGYNAFKGCIGLIDITIPNSVTKIGDSAFYDCTGLTSIMLGDGVKEIGYNAFKGCIGLTEITIPNSVTEIGSNVFNGCSIKDVIWNAKDAEGPQSESIFDGITLNSIIFGDAVESIPSYICRNQSELNTIIIPKSVTFIDYAAFENCVSLKKLKFEDGTNVLECSQAFNGCSIDTIYIGRDFIIEYSYGTPFSGMTFNTVILGDNITTISDYMFYGHNSLTSLTIPNTVKSIGEGAFWECSGLTDIVIPNTVKSIGDYAFNGCVGLTDLTIPSGIIGSSVFSGCTGLTSIKFGDGVTIIGQYALSGCYNLTLIEIGRGLEGLDGAMFHNLEKLERIIIDKGNKKYDSRDNCNAVVETGTNTLLYGCKGSKIPSGITSIGEDAFYGCSGITAINIPNSVSAIGNFAFYECENLKTLSIGLGITSIGDGAFEDCTELNDITILGDVTSFGDGAFYNTSWYNSHPDGILYIDKCCLGYKGNKPSGYLTLNLGTRVVANGAFADCYDLKTVIIPNTVVTIGNEAFEDCISLKLLDIPISVVNIGEEAFSSCDSLMSVTIPNKVKEIKDHTFDYCISLNEVTIGASVDSIGVKAFYGCTSLKAIKVLNEFPPHICDVTTFGLVNKEDCIVYVPKGTLDLYKKAEYWCDFYNIVEMDFDGVEDIKINKTDVVEVDRYDIYGRQLTEPTKGINIIKMSDGTTRKEYVK